MIRYIFEFCMLGWAAWCVRLINRQTPWCLYISLCCNLSFINWWIYTGQYGFLAGDAMFTLMYLTEIKKKWVDLQKMQKQY
jgi:hypothetical protein